jgi:hypothetical protein
MLLIFKKITLKYLHPFKEKTKKQEMGRTAELQENIS